MTGVSFLYCTSPDPKLAERIGAALVEEGLAACVNILPGMRSVYKWEGRVEAAEETVFIIKTMTSCAPAARDRILALHPYDCPCVIAFPADEEASSAAFLEWIETATNS